MRQETVKAMLLAALTASLVAAFGPPPVDASAHSYRTLLLREGVHLWDNLWYAGQYPFTSYSLLYYPPAAAVGNVPLVALAGIASAGLFASLLVLRFGDAGRWPARAFGLLAAGPLVTGTHSYAVGLTFALASLLAAQTGRLWLAALGAGLSLGFCPLAFLFLCLTFAAVVLARRRVGAPALALGAGLVLLVGFQLAMSELFPSEGVYPFGVPSLLGVLTASALGTALALRARRGRALAAFFALWGLASLAAFLVPTPLGSNVARLRFLVFPLGLLTASLAGFRPRLLASTRSRSRSSTT